MNGFYLAGASGTPGRGYTLSDNFASGNGENGFLVVAASSTFNGNLATGNTLNGFRLESSSTGNSLQGNYASSNSGFGYLDESSGSGTAGTANTYAKNTCPTPSNTLGCSKPPGLAT